MKMEITQKKENPLQKRVEVYFKLDHAGESTPGRNAVTEEVAKHMSNGYAKVYDSKEAALEFEK